MKVPRTSQVIRLVIVVLTLMFHDSSFAKSVEKLAVKSTASSKINVDVKFDYPDTKLRMELYDVTPEYIYSVARTVVARSLSATPLTKKLKNPLLFTADEPEKTFALVVKNETKQNRYFFASPHTVGPGEASLGVLFECLCNHHVYKVPPGAIWYRIVRMKVDFSESNLKNLKNVSVTHSIVEVPEEKALKDYNQMLYDQANEKGESSEK